MRVRGHSASNKTVRKDRSAVLTQLMGLKVVRLSVCFVLLVFLPTLWVCSSVLHDSSNLTHSSTSFANNNHDRSEMVAGDHSSVGISTNQSRMVSPNQLIQPRHGHNGITVILNQQTKDSSSSKSSLSLDDGSDGNNGQNDNKIEIVRWKNVSFPKHLIPYDQIEIDSLVWDFGANGCSGWGIETVNILLGLVRNLHGLNEGSSFDDYQSAIQSELSHKIKNQSRKKRRMRMMMKVITSPNQWCLGFNSHNNFTIPLLDSLQKFDERDLMSLNHDEKAKESQFLSWMDKRTKQKRKIEFFVSHKPANRYPRFPYDGSVYIQHQPKFVIGRSMTEVTPLRESEVRRYNLDGRHTGVDEIWVPSSFVRKVFIDSGVNPNKIVVIEEPITLEYDLDPSPVPRNQHNHNNQTQSSRRGSNRLFFDEFDENGQRLMNFLSIFKWEPRKGYDVLLWAFFEEFYLSHQSWYHRNDESIQYEMKRDDDWDGRVRLNIQTYLFNLEMHGRSQDARNPDSIMDEIWSVLNSHFVDSDDNNNNNNNVKIISKDIWMEHLNDTMKWLKNHIKIHSRHLSMSEMRSLMNECDVYVSSSKGEGFGLPILDAMHLGKATITTNWSGINDITGNEDGQYSMKISLNQSHPLIYAQNSPGLNDFDTSLQRYANVDLNSLKRQMRKSVNLFFNEDKSDHHDQRGKLDEMGLRGKNRVDSLFNSKVISLKIIQRMKEIIFLDQFT